MHPRSTGAGKFACQLVTKDVLLDIWSNIKRKHPGLLPLHAHTIECDGDVVLMVPLPVFFTQPVIGTQFWMRTAWFRATKIHQH